MPIVNQERWSHVQFFSEHDFLELGTTSSGAKIIQKSSNLNNNRCEIWSEQDESSSNDSSFND